MAKKKKKTTLGGVRKGAGRHAISIIPLKPEKLVDGKSIDLNKLQTICEIGANMDQIAAYFGISTTSISNLKKRHPEMAEIMSNAHERGKISAKMMLWQKAAKGCTASIIFLNKNVNNMSDNLRAEHTGPDGKPIQVQADVSAVMATVEGFLSMVTKSKREADANQVPIIEAHPILAIRQADSVRGESEMAQERAPEADPTTRY